MSETQSTTAAIIADARKEFEVKDSAGRTIVLRKPGVLAQFRTVEMVGGESAKNEVFMGMILPVTYVCRIDGVDVPHPNTRRELDALIQRLDEHGLSAVVEGVVKHFDAGKSPEDHKADIKK